jgi:purine-nucleoside phosphorylase
MLVFDGMPIFAGTLAKTLVQNFKNIAKTRALGLMGGMRDKIPHHENML